MHLEYILEDETRKAEMGLRAKETAYLYSTWNFCTMAESLYKEVLKRQEQRKKLPYGHIEFITEFYGTEKGC